MAWKLKGENYWEQVVDNPFASVGTNPRRRIWVSVQKTSGSPNALWIVALGKVTGFVTRTRLNPFDTQAQAEREAKAYMRKFPMGEMPQKSVHEPKAFRSKHFDTDWAEMEK